MQVLEIRDRFGLERLTRAERPEPRPGAGRIVVRMRAASLNYRDLLTVRGHYNPKQPLPLIPGSDGVGEVVAVGQGVDGIRVGERVVPTFCQRWICGRPTRDRLRSTLGGPLDGTLAEAIELEADGVVRPPEHLSDEEAATLPCAARTAWSALFEQGELRPGQTVLIQGTGGVSIFALQFAVAAGARAIVTSSREAKLERARALGAWQTIDYRGTPAWGKRVLEMTGGLGVDHVVEVGGAGTLAQSLQAVRMGGRIHLIGVLAGGRSEIDMIPAFMKQVRIQGILVGDRDGFEAMNRAIDAWKLRPVVDRVLPWLEARDAFEAMAAGDHVGKICLTF